MIRCSLLVLSCLAAASAAVPAFGQAARTNSEITAKLYRLGYPVRPNSVLSTIGPAIAQWRYRTNRTGGASPLSEQEQRELLAEPDPKIYGAFAGDARGKHAAVWGKPTRGAAEAAAKASCEAAKNGSCTNVYVLTDDRCMAFAAASRSSGGQTIATLVGVPAASATEAQNRALTGCMEKPDDAPHCKLVRTICANRK